MRYWEDMLSKYGFHDGEAIPEGIQAYRTVYIRAVNRLAEQLGSEVRAVAYDRFGLHNVYLILFYRVTDLQAIPSEHYTSHMDIQAEVAAIDEAMDDAIWQAHSCHLDNLLLVTVEIDPDLDAFIHTLKPDDSPSNTLFN